ncbi:related to OST3 - oligosaccharyltransferase gamma subunit [Pseudozyma flocculosa]|uniref:Related to OST3 - oligosaccharyltransferase gamma subunit n=1 Tax=Pseudozyma flocculosa TaxID=84751 RepID=A0A5C3F4X8_9BASI|nr:related to OST3 - oligosaccharyltransferase gamma subunit [Pseudozyma flocculosa]
MRLPTPLTLLGALMLPLLASSAKQSSARDAQLVQRQKDLYRQAATSSSGFVDVDTADFQALVHVPRDYAITALLTTTDKVINCPPCLTFQPDFENIAASWNRDKARRSKNVFAKVEFSRAREVFKLFQLQHAPVLMTFPASTPSNPTPDPISYDFNRFGFEGSDLAAHLSKTFDVPFRYAKPLNYRLIAGVATAVVVVVTTLVFVAPKLSTVMPTSSKPLWMLLSLSSMIVFTSGQMWNQIRNAPYLSADRGRVQYFASGFQNQYGAETQIVAAIYALLAFSFVALIVLVPAQRDPTRQRAGVYVWSAIMLGTFSVLFAIFRMKK